MNIAEIKKIFDTRTFKYEVLIAFWLCIHLERLDLAQCIYEQDPLLEKILQNLRKQGKGILEMEKQKAMINNQTNKGKSVKMGGVTPKDDKKAT